MAEPLRHRQTKGAGTDMLSLTSPRHTSTLPILLKNPLFWCQHLGFVAMSARQIPGAPPHVAKMGVGSGMSFASFWRFLGGGG
jgi:hypothetical protein